MDSINNTKENSNLDEQDYSNHAQDHLSPGGSTKLPDSHKSRLPEPGPWTTSKSQAQQQSSLSKQKDARPELPVLYLPSDIVPTRDSAMALMEELGNTGTVFSRNGQVVRLHDVEGADYRLTPLTSKELPSFSQKFFKFHRKDWKKNSDEIIDRPRNFNPGDASAILGCSDAVELVHKISKELAFPPIDSEGNVLASGYHPEHELLVTSKVSLQKIPEGRAARLLRDLFADWRFATPADLSRAIAALLAPMLRFGVNIKPSLIMPLFMVEADHSQTGKGHLISMISEIYGEQVSLITQKKGGVGSLDESFNKALLDGHPLISFDNLRGKMDSTALEAFVTANGKFSVRALRADGVVDSRNFVIYATSNQFEVTPDLANRICVIRIQKQPAGYKWKEWPEGSLLRHIKANRGLYLSAVAAVMGSWVQDGMPSIACLHPQREWAASMNYIVQRLFSLPPLMETHASFAFSKETSLSVFLTEFGNSLGDDLDSSFTAASMIAHAESASIRLPVETEGDEAKGKQLQLGGLLSEAFGSGDTLEVDGCQIDRFLTRQRRPDGDGYFESKTYRFRRAELAQPESPVTAATAATAVRDEGDVRVQAVDEEIHAPEDHSLTELAQPLSSIDSDKSSAEATEPR